MKATYTLLIILIPFVGLGQCIKGNCTNGQGTYTWASGNKYVGGFKDGKRNGQGTYTWASGNKYVGGFKDGKRTGQGTFTWALAHKYVGGFKNGKRTGQGTLSFTEKYIGFGYEGITLGGGKYKLTKVIPNSPAEKVGLSIDDIILTVNNLTHSQKKQTRKVGEKYVLTVKKANSDKITELNIEEDYVYSDVYQYTGEFKNGIKNGFFKILYFNGEQELSLFDNNKKININEYVKLYVENKINEWQKKEEFEKTKDYKKRVTRSKRLSKIETFQKEAINILNEIYTKYTYISDFYLGDYDADNETFILKHTFLGNFVISVTFNKAKKFKSKFDYNSSLEDIKFKQNYNEFILSNFNILVKGVGKFSYNLLQSDEYQTYEIDYNFSEIEFNPVEPYTTNTNSIKTQNISLNLINLKTDIPRNKQVKNRYAIVIGNENYSSFQKTLDREQDVPFAVNDAKTFKKYALEALGVEEENLYFLENATSSQINQTIDLVTKIVNKLGNEAELIFYYAGHGFPDELTKEPYLIPVDVSTSYLNNAISLDDLYDKFSKTGAKRVLAFVDACFSGGARENSLLVSRGVKINPKMTNISNNLVVFSASSETQSALPYDEQGHGMFTFYLLNKLKESSGKISLGELYDYISEEVSLNSLKINQTEQEPNVIFSPTIENKWRNWQLY